MESPKIIRLNVSGQQMEASKKLLTKIKDSLMAKTFENAIDLP